MSNRFDPQSGNLRPAPRNGSPHPAADHNPDRPLPPCPSHPPAMSQNVPECPTLQNNLPPDAPRPAAASPAHQAPGDYPTAADIPDYQPAQTPAPDEPPLSDKQRLAIHLLLQGLSDTAVAKRLGLNRRTIHRWKWEHPRFYNTLDEAQRQAWNDAYGLLRSSVLQSALKLNQLIKKGKPEDAIKAAKVLLSAPVLTRLEQ
jgi:hypothetical protein